MAPTAEGVQVGVPLLEYRMYPNHERRHMSIVVSDAQKDTPEETDRTPDRETGPLDVQTEQDNRRESTP